jgi:hypothetical protein
LSLVKAQIAGWFGEEQSALAPVVSDNRRRLIMPANSGMNGLAPGHGTCLPLRAVTDAIKPAEQVRLAVRVTEADGYTAVVALAEISPKFAGRLFGLPTT